jgi:hypothetical protein
MTCTHVEKCLSHSGGITLTHRESECKVREDTSKKVLLGDANQADRSYVLLTFRSVPVYVSAMPYKGFSAANKPYCGTEQVRCQTITYARTQVDDQLSKYEVKVYYGWYEENYIRINDNDNLNLIITGESRDGTCVMVKSHEDESFCLFLFVWKCFLFFFI